MELHFAPYGETVFDESFLREDLSEYGDVYARKRVQSLGVYPTKSPYVTALHDVCQFTESIPYWWNEEIKIVPQPLQYVLSTISLDEFKTGVINEKVWKGFRDMLRGDKNKYPQSPKIGGIIKDYPELAKMFTDRGAKSNGQLELVIASDPRPFFYMSNGKGWDSCQHYRYGSQNEHLAGNWYDPYVGIAYVHEVGNDISEENSLYCRMTFRIMRNPLDETLMVVLGRSYQNDMSVNQDMVNTFVHLVEAKGYSWGMFENANTYIYFADPVMPDRTKRTSLIMSGQPTIFPAGIEYPYTDGYRFNGIGNKHGYRVVAASGSVVFTESEE